jgi:hypothetical protein
MWNIFFILFIDYLQNLGLTAPLPTLAMGLTALVGAGAAFFIFQSASRE